MILAVVAEQVGILKKALEITGKFLHVVHCYVTIHVSSY